MVFFADDNENNAAWSRNRGCAPEVGEDPLPLTCRRTQSHISVVAVVVYNRSRDLHLRIYNRPDKHVFDGAQQCSVANLVASVQDPFPPPPSSGLQSRRSSSNHESRRDRCRATARWRLLSATSAAPIRCSTNPQSTATQTQMNPSDLRAQPRHHRPSSSNTKPPRRPRPSTFKR